MSSEALAVHQVHRAITRTLCPSKGSGPSDAHGKRSRAVYTRVVTPSRNLLYFESMRGQSHILSRTYSPSGLAPLERTA